MASVSADGLLLAISTAYVRVPSGKQFYLYVLQTIDTADASLGGTAIAITAETDEPVKTKSRP